VKIEAKILDMQIKYSLPDIVRNYIEIKKTDTQHYSSNSRLIFRLVLMVTAS